MSVLERVENLLGRDVRRGQASLWYAGVLPALLIGALVCVLGSDAAPSRLAAAEAEVGRERRRAGDAERGEGGEREAAREGVSLNQLVVTKLALQMSQLLSEPQS